MKKRHVIVFSILLAGILAGLFFLLSRRGEGEENQTQTVAQTPSFEEIQNRKVILHVDQDTIQVGMEDFASATGSAISYDETRVQNLITGMQKRYDKPAVNARINKKGKVIKEQAGRCLDTSQIYKDLTSYLSSTDTQDFEKTYQTQKVPAQWTRAKVKKCRKKIASYTSYFTTGGTRGFNIELGASRVNQTFLLPGESVSFEDLLYDDSDQKKYRKANAIYKGQIVQAAGGGICQISSTAYNALLRAGIIPLKRYPHMLPVSYVPLGLDAAISVGGKDLVVKNTLDYPMIFRVSARGGVLTTQILSNKKALKGCRYQPRTKVIHSKKAKTYLDVYKKSKKIKTIKLGTSIYD